MTVHHVNGIECALIGGDRLRLAAADAGPDLLGVVIGSEGTLGIVTRATLNLLPLPAVTRTLLAVFDDADAAARAVSAIIVAGVVPAALAIFVSLNTWNDFLWPLIVTNSAQMRTLPVGLSTLQGQYRTDWNLLMAGSVIAMLPVLIVYIIAQRWFIRGITLSGMGGR